MASIYAIVKGGPESAILAAEIRDIPSEVVEGMARPGETLLRVPATYAADVYAWAVEPGSVPYPTGACVGMYRGAA